MNDTSPNIAMKMQEMMEKKAPEERLRIGCSMFGLSKELVKNSIIQNHPAISPAGLRRELFLRFYGIDFDLSRQEKIIRFLLTR